VDQILFLVDFILHIDVHLAQIVSTYQVWTLLILFLIVFCETGLVVTPFLPGDSLLFAAGAISALEGTPVGLTQVMLTIFFAALIGDSTNYCVGRFLGQKVYEKNYRLIKREYLLKTEEFYKRHGGKTVIIARFMPFLRTFAPFVAGVGRMNYPRFFSFSLIGNIIWVNCFCLAGHFFGNIPFVKKNFTAVIMAIIVISVIPPVITVLKQKMAKKKTIA